MSEPFRRGDILTADKLNAALAGRPLTVSGSGRLSRDAKGDLVTIDQPETIYVRLTGKTGTTPIKYSWKEVYRNASGAWVNTDRTGTTSGDYAIELNNSDLSTTDNYVYRAERSPESGEWLFFLRRSGISIISPLNYKFTGTYASNSYPLYGFGKVWGNTTSVVVGSNCTSSSTTDSSNSTYTSITYWYTPSGGTRANLTTFYNNGTSSPINVIQTSNVSFPGTIGVDCVYSDGYIWGSYNPASGGVNAYAQTSSANTTASQYVTNGNSTVSLVIVPPVTYSYPTNTNTIPSSVTYNFDVSYSAANALWPAATQTAYNAWSASIASGLSSLSIGSNSISYFGDGSFPFTYGRQSGTPTHTIDVSSGSGGSTTLKLWLWGTSDTLFQGATSWPILPCYSSPHYYVGSDRVSTAGVNTELKFSFYTQGGGDMTIGYNATGGTSSTTTRRGGFDASLECGLNTSWDPSSYGRLLNSTYGISSLQIFLTFADGSGTYSQTFSLSLLSRS